MAIYTADYLVEWKPSGSWVDITAHIKEVAGDLAISGNRANALSFGDASDITCTLSTINLSLQATAYEDVPIRVTFTMNGTSELGFVGIIAGRDRDQETLTFRCEGYQRLIRRTRVYSAASFRRPVATATTVSSVEDPDEGGYSAGLINYALWKAGGRPAEQDFAYPNATFYYSCHNAILAPEWSWLAGEDAWEECLKLARASGGQLYQGADGIVRYIQPLSFGDGTASYIFNEDVYGDLQEKTASDLTVTKVLCPFIPRTARSVQEVINDSEPRLVEAGGSLTITLEAQQPLKSLLLSAGTLPIGALKTVFFDGAQALPATHYTHTVTLLGQQITISITNISGKPFVVTNIVLKGEPIVAGEAGTESWGSGDVTLNIPDNPYIQSQSHARRIAQMTQVFHGTTLPIRTASGCVYDPDRFVGESVNLTCSRWSLSSVKHLIVAIRQSETGLESEYDLVPVVGLPASSDFFIIGTTSYTGQTKKLGF